MVKAMGDSDIALPTQDEIDAALTRFQADWGLVDKVLYDLCAAYPGHDERAVVTAKIAIVGRVYAAGLERRVTPPAGRQAIEVIGEYAHGHGGEIDEIVHGLDEVGEPLSASAMTTVVAQHGRLTTLLQGVATDGKAPRSFASKYLHFHRSVVPIYDEYARRSLSRLVPWDGSYQSFLLPPEGDQQYWSYCVRFFRLQEACREAGVRTTVKMLDALLWAAST